MPHTSTAAPAASAPRHHRRRRHKRDAKRQSRAARLTGGAAPQIVGQPQPTEPAPSSDTDDQVTSVIADPWSESLGSSDEGAAALGRLVGLIGTSDYPSRRLIRIYKAAGRRYHIRWQILAAINAIETDYGRNTVTSSAGAIGWMQFMPATWRRYAVGTDAGGRPNPYDARDSIFAAARLLASNGGMRHIRRALRAYNHAEWYVDAVLWRAQVITDWSSKGQRHDGMGYALPLDARYMKTLGRTDDGVDIETAPDGAAVYSITPGVVTAVASDPAGFGPDYPVIRATAGPLKGEYIYYGHVAASLVHVGQRVRAGQPIAVVGHTGDAASLGHGHVEIGFSDAVGDPLNHHGAVAATAAGNAMRGLLVELSRTFGMHNA
jgi:murein DD-endopeptidase MepM/ murein hydrolase activator NlpD